MQTFEYLAALVKERITQKLLHVTNILGYLPMHYNSILLFRQLYYKLTLRFIHWGLRLNYQYTHMRPMHCVIFEIHSEKVCIDNTIECCNTAWHAVCNKTRSCIWSPCKFTWSPRKLTRSLRKLSWSPCKVVFYVVTACNIIQYSSQIRKFAYVVTMCNFEFCYKWRAIRTTRCHQQSRTSRLPAILGGCVGVQYLAVVCDNVNMGAMSW